MTVEYGMLTNPYIRYDGTNSEEILSAFQSYLTLPDWTTVEISNENPLVELVIYIDNGSSGTRYITIPLNHRIGVTTQEIISDSDWTTKYAKP